MVIRALHRKLLREFKALRTQTMILSLLIICGVSLIVSAWSAYRSLLDCKNRYYSDNQFADLFSEFKAAPFGVLHRLSQISGIKAVEGRIVMDGLIGVKNTSEPAVGRFVSIPSGEQPRLNRLHLRMGRLPLNGGNVEAVVHEAFAKAHQLHIGDQIEVVIRGQKDHVTIVGIGLSPEFVYALSATTPLPDDLHFGVVWLPLRQLERMSRLSQSMNSVVAQLEPSATEETIDKVDRMLKPYGNHEVQKRSRQISNMFVEDEIRQQRASIVTDPLIFLGVAAFLLHTILSRLVAIHRPQIATLKSLGYSDPEITRHYLELIIFMVLPGSILGLLAGHGLGKLLLLSYERFFHFPTLDFNLNWEAIFIGFSAGIVPGLMGGWLSLRRVYQLSAVDAMRSPVPAAYQIRLLDRLPLMKKAKIPTRMFWRSFFMKPTRLLMTIAGISMALAILITAHSWSDMIQFLLQTEFQRIQREDMRVGFWKPVPLGAFRELEQISGVISLEGFRVEPVRLRFRHHERLLTLEGVPREIRMHRKMNSDLKPLSVPENGLVISRYFEKEWGMRPGDIVHLETLQGKLKNGELKVRAFSDDLFGTGAMMGLQALSEFLEEQPAYNGAYLKLDPLLVSEVYQKIKDKPVVSSLIMKQQMYRSFEKTMAGMIRMMMNLLIGFALLIASGVIFNSVRISLSEKSWELSSLRVLGFEKNQVIRSLVQESVFQFLASLLPGCLMGYGLIHLTMKSIHTETFGFPVVIFPETYSLSILVLFLSLLLSSTWVYRRVGNMVLMEALRIRE
jgi:putative ABC transport system permease protein